MVSLSTFLIFKSKIVWQNIVQSFEFIMN